MNRQHTNSEATITTLFVEILMPIFCRVFPPPKFDPLSPKSIFKQN